MCLISHRSLVVLELTGQYASWGNKKIAPGMLNSPVIDHDDVLALPREGHFGLIHDLPQSLNCLSTDGVSVWKGHGLCSVVTRVIQSQVSHVNSVEPHPFPRSLVHTDCRKYFGYCLHRSVFEPLDAVCRPAFSE